MIASKYIGMDSIKQSPDLDSPGLFSEGIKSYINLLKQRIGV